MAQDLEFGDKECNVSNISALEHFLKENKINESSVQFCSWNDGARCDDKNLTEFCKWWYSGTGITYELLVGPLFMVVLSFTGIPVSLVSEAKSFNRKTILSICVFGWSIATLVTGWATQYWQVAIVRMMLALFEAPYLTFSSSLASCYFSKKHRSIVIATLQIGVFVGFGSAFLLSVLDEALGWRWTYWLSGIPGLVISVIIFITVKELKPHDKPITNKKVNIMETLRVFKSPEHIMLVLAMSVRNGSGFVFAYNINNYFHHYYPNYPTEIFMTWSPVVTGCIGTAIGGLLADYLSRRWGSAGRLLVVILSTFVASPLFVGALLTPPPGAFYWLLAFATLSELWLGVGLSVIIDISPKHTITSCLAVYYFSYTMIGGNLNVLVTPMTDAYGWRVTMMILIVGCLVTAGVLFSIVACLLIRKSSRTVSENNILNKSIFLNT
ncbi:D-galactonate transporter-like isoform X2 [Antedon mediterranea]